MSESKQSKITITFVLLFLLFTLPLTLASWMYIKGKTPFPHTTNQGELIQPPLHIKELEKKEPSKVIFEEHYWWLLYINPHTCDAICAKMLYNLRQIHTATGKDSDRVKRAILTLSEQPSDNHLNTLLTTEFAGTTSFQVPRSKLTQFLKENHFLETTLQTGGIYLIDPMGNMMMFYSLATPPMDIFKDLTHLLKLSSSS